VTLHYHWLRRFCVRCYPLAEVCMKNTPFRVLIVLLSSGESSLYRKTIKCRSCWTETLEHFEYLASRLLSSVSFPPRNSCYLYLLVGGTICSSRLVLIRSGMHKSQVTSSPGDYIFYSGAKIFIFENLCTVV
jgi:hypothetical protein